MAVTRAPNPVLLPQTVKSLLLA